MTSFKKVTEEPPPINTLLLVKQDMTGVCLRLLNEQYGWYNENEVFDDSELEITEWRYIPE